MKIRSLLTLVGLAISFALPTFAQQKDTVDPEVAQKIRALAKKYDEAFSKNDAAALAGLFAEDAVQVAPEGIFYGRQAIEKRYGDIVFQQWHCNNHVQQIGQVIAVGNEAVWVGEWSASCGGNQVHGYISNVAVREGDAWKVRISTFNVTPPPPPAQTNISPTAGQEQKTVDPELRQQIEALDMKLGEAMNKHDAAAVAALYTRDAVRVENPPSMGAALLVGRKAMEKLFETEFTASWSSSPTAGKVVQIYAFEDSIATISEWSIGKYNGHSVKIFVRDADTGTWKIRMEYNSLAPVVTH